MTNEQKKVFEAVAAKFPAEFGLAGFPGDVFRISEGSSYFGGADNKTLMLYTECFREQGGWFDFAKGTEAELLRQVRKL